MRDPIYFHDEDYRYSFLYGNFITLTNLTSKELNRIVQQKLSPLYISIHATDSEVRKKLFCHKKDDQLMEKLKFLTSHGILIHAQIVLVPGLNDEEILAANRQFLKHDYITDVISFDLSEQSGNNRCFDIIVNGDLAVSQAEKRKHSPDAELALYICHGLLHCLGFDDRNDADAKKMHQTEDDILQTFGFGVVYNKDFKN